MASKHVAKTGSDSNGGTSFVDAYLTIGKFESVAAAGDDVTIYVGSYSEQIAPTVSGTSGNAITYNVDTGATVTVQRINVDGRNYINVNDVAINDTAFLRADTCDNIHIDAITLDGQSSAGGNPLGRMDDFTNGSLTNSTITADHDFYADVLIINGATNHNEISGNTWDEKNPSLADDPNKIHSFIQLNGVGGYTTTDPQFNYIKNNNFNNTRHHIIEFKDGASWNYLDNNVLKQAGTGTKGSTRYQGKSIGLWSSDNIIRFNKVSKGGQKDDIASTMINMWGSNENGSDENKCTGNYLIHNTFYRAYGVFFRAGSSWDGIGTGSDYDVGNNVIKNNIFYDGNFDAGSTYGNLVFYYHKWGSSKGAGVPAWNDTVEYNLIENETAGTDLVYHEGTQYTLAEAESTLTDHAFANNVTGDPLFNDPATYDYTLTTGSAAHDAGGNLTTVTSATSSGTVFTVADAKYFTDGDGVVTADTIKIGSNTRTISSINQATNEITVTVSVSWTVGDAVNHEWFGTAPNIGAESAEPAGGGGGGGGSADFKVQRGTITISGGSATGTATITAVGALTSAYVRITGCNHTAGGELTSGTAADMTNENYSAYVVLTNTTTVTATRVGVPGSTDTELYFEVVEYIGAASGANEFIVRYNGTVTMSSVATNTATITTATDANDVVPFIAGVNNDQNGVDSARLLATAKVNSTTQIQVDRVDAAGVCVVGIQAVEFTGSNWTVQNNITHTVTTASTDETETITAVTWANSFIEAGFRTGGAFNSSLSYVVRPGATTTTVRFYAGTNTTATLVAHVVSNDSMTVQHIDSITGGESDLPAGSADPQTVNYTVTTIPDLEQASVIAFGGDSTAAQNPPAFAWQYRLSSTTNLEYKRARHIASSKMGAQIISAWPSSLAAPTNVATTPGAGSLTLTFDPVAGATSHNIYWDTASPITTGDTKISTIATSYEHTGLTPGTTYYYAITAEDGSGESALSSEVSGVPLASGILFFDLNGGFHNLSGGLNG